VLPFYLADPNPAAYFSSNFFVLDFETTNLEKGDSRVADNRIVCGALKREGHSAELLDVSPKGLKKALPKKGVLVAHNAKFELGWLIRNGIDITEYLVWDTMIAEYVIYGNLTVPLDLGSVCERWGLPGKEPVIDALMTGGVCPSEMPSHMLHARVLRDVETAATLFWKQLKYMNENGLLPVMLTRCIVTPVLAHIERRGMRLDAERVKAEVDKVRTEFGMCQQAITEMLDGRNPNSPQQLAEFLYDVLKFDEARDRRGNPKRTKTGKRSTNKDILATLKAVTPEQKKFVELQAKYAKLSSALSKSLEFFAGVVDEHGGVFVANFHQTRTKTHRLSSSGRRLTFKNGKSYGVQFQNMAREYKRLFRGDGKIVEVDGSGLEFRIGGDLGHDDQVLADILDPNHDPHTYTATVLHNCAAEAVTKKVRTAAKRHTFKPLFSEGKSGTKAEVAYYQAFKQRYHKMTATQEGWVAEVLRTGKLRLPSGLIAYWDLKVSPSGFIEYSNQVRNLPIQSFATADIIPVSLVYTFWRTRFAVDAKILNTVHDSVVADVAEKDVDRYKEIAVSCFTTDTTNYLQKVYNHTMFVPLGVGITTGTHWGEGEEETH
jgi:DNA polymerase I